MKTRTEVFQYLCGLGHPQNLVKAAVNEALNYDEEGDTRDLCCSYEFTGERGEIDVSKETARMIWGTMFEMLQFVKGGIAVDGELLYDMNGDKL